MNTHLITSNVEHRIFNYKALVHGEYKFHAGYVLYVEELYQNGDHQSAPTKRIS